MNVKFNKLEQFRFQYQYKYEHHHNSISSIHMTMSISISIRKAIILKEARTGTARTQSESSLMSDYSLHTHTQSESHKLRAENL